MLKRRGFFGFLGAALPAAAVVSVASPTSRPALTINRLPTFVADLVARNQDWPDADRMAARLAKILPPQPSKKAGGSP